MKTKRIFAVVIIFVLIIASYTLTRYINGENSIPDSHAANDTVKNNDAIPEADAESMNETEPDNQDEILAVTSSTGKYRAFTREYNSQMLYIYDNNARELDSIEVTPSLTTGITSIEWFDETKVAVYSHVNPSLGCLDIYDAATKENLVEKYCSYYAWTDGLDSLIYVEPAPHFSSKIGKTKIRNYDDDILYQTKKNVVIRGIAENEEGNLAVIAEKMTKYYDVEETKLLFLKKMNDNGISYYVSEQKKLNSHSIENLKWVSNQKVTYKAWKKKKSITFSKKERDLF